MQGLRAILKSAPKTFSSRSYKNMHLGWHCRTLVQAAVYRLCVLTSHVKVPPPRSGIIENCNNRRNSSGTCRNLLKLVKTRENSLKFIKTHQLVKTYRNSSKIVKCCRIIFDDATSEERGIRHSHDL